MLETERLQADISAAAAVVHHQTYRGKIEIEALMPFHYYYYYYYYSERYQTSVFDIWEAQNEYYYSLLAVLVETLLLLLSAAPCL